MLEVPEHIIEGNDPVSNLDLFPGPSVFSCELANHLFVLDCHVIEVGLGSVFLEIVDDFAFRELCHVCVMVLIDLEVRGVERLSVLAGQD